MGYEAESFGGIEVGNGEGEVYSERVDMETIPDGMVLQSEQVTTISAGSEAGGAIEALAEENRELRDRVMQLEAELAAALSD
jgi:hypothetical protein